MEKQERKLVKAYELVVEMAPKSPRKDKEAVKDTALATKEAVLVKKIKGKSVHPLLPKTSL